MMASQEIHKISDDRIKVDLSDQVRQILLDLKEMVVSHLVTESPATKRIFPVAYKNSPEMEMDYKKLTREPLSNHHEKNLDILESTLHNSELTIDEALAWIGALNNMRLILGTALDVKEDQDFPGEDDPNYEGYVVYDLLTYLQGSLIEEIQ